MMKSGLIVIWLDSSGMMLCERYLQSELPVTLGLGRSPQIEILTIRWPSGALTQLKNVKANQSIAVREGKGIVRRQPFRQH